MSGGIAVSRKNAWMVAGWAYHEVLDRAEAKVEEGSDVWHVLESGRVNTMVFLHLDEPAVARATAGVLLAVCDEVFELHRQGTPIGSIDDKNFVPAVEELAAMLRSGWKTEDQASQVEWVRETTAALAMPAAEQLAYLRENGWTRVDALTGIFRNALRLVPELRAAGVLGPRLEQALDAVRAKVKMMGESIDLWTEEALRGSAEWAEVRRLAAEALSRFPTDSEVDDA